jgi:hypothetical protein
MAGAYRFGRPGGFCAYNFLEASSRTRGIVAACGPATSIAAGVASAALWFRTGGLVQDACWWMAMLGIGEGLICAIPLALTDSAGNRVRTDGRHVLDALRGADQALIERMRRQAASAERSVPPPAR